MQQILTNQAPQPIGPYSQAVITGKFLFCSGQIALDPLTGQLLNTGIQDQTKRVMDNLQAVLLQSGSSFDQVLKTTVYLTDMNNFSLFNEVYAKYFSSNPPARSTVQVAALPKGALIEIELIAEIAQN